MITEAIATTTKFQLALSVADLPRSVEFYRLLLQCEPIEAAPGMVRFEPEQPALALTLTRGGPSAVERTLNHVGIRMPDQAGLVELQRRLEAGGIATQRQDGVACCYARQTKFWVTDPDKLLWELYILHEDLDHSGFDDHHATEPWKPKRTPISWTHRLIEPIPERLDLADGGLDAVQLEGTFNGPIDDAARGRFLAEIFRALAPGGTISVHGMAGDRPFPGTPAFGGLAAKVKRVPTHAEFADALRQAGFVNLFLEKFDGICLSMPGMDLREIRIVGTRPEHAGAAGDHAILYRGPFEEAADDDGTIYRRGQRTLVSPEKWHSLQQGPVAEQFVFFPPQAG